MISIANNVPASALIPHELTPKRSAVILRTPIMKSPIHSSSSATAAAAAAAVPKPLVLTSGASGRVSALFSLRALYSLLNLLSGFLLLLFLPFSRRTTKSSSATSMTSSSATVAMRVPAAMVPRRVREGEAAARRAMAIKRVARDDAADDVGGARACIRRYELFATARGDTMFTRSWTPAAVCPKAVVVIMHGLNEHSGRYDYFAKQLNDHAFKVYGMDWIGHGGSDGLHGYVPSLDYAVNDLRAFLQKVLAENPGLPCFLFGHSTGAAIILKTILDPEVRMWINGVVLTSPAIRVQPSHPLVAVFAPVISLIAPRYQFSGANQGPPVSRDPIALKEKYSDPLVFTGAIRVRTGYEILRITTFLQQNLNRVDVPFLVLHGKSDSVTDPKATQSLYDMSPSTDKSIKLYDGLLHDLLFEPERDEIAKDIISWLTSKLSRSTQA